MKEVYDLIDILKHKLFNCKEKTLSLTSQAIMKMIDL